MLDLGDSVERKPEIPERVWHNHDRDRRIRKISNEFHYLLSLMHLGNLRGHWLLTAEVKVERYRQERRKNAQVKQHAQEEAHVVEAYTVIDPHAVPVHVYNVAIACRTMIASVRLQRL